MREDYKNFILQVLRSVQVLLEQVSDFHTPGTDAFNALLGSRDKYIEIEDKIEAGVDPLNRDDVFLIYTALTVLRPRRQKEVDMTNAVLYGYDAILKNIEPFVTNQDIPDSEIPELFNRELI